MPLDDEPVPWPSNDDATAIAVASRIVLLEAVARGNCPVSGQTPDQKHLLQLVEMVTTTKKVQGRTFAEFLEQAKQAIADSTRLLDEPDSVQCSLDEIMACEPADPVGDLYAALTDCMKAAYSGFLDDIHVPELRRRALRADDRAFYVKGAVNKSRDRVTVNFYSGFDLTALALLPYILGHELVCHAAARDIGEWVTVPDPDVRMYFAEGFMNQAARTLVRQWWRDGSLPVAAPLGCLEAASVAYEAERPAVFRAGGEAWENCVQAVAGRLRLMNDPPPVTSLGVVIRVALVLNARASHICGKDRFAGRAQRADRGALGLFGNVGLNGDDIAKLIDQHSDDDA